MNDKKGLLLFYCFAVWLSIWWQIASTQFKTHSHCAYEWNESKSSVIIALYVHIKTIQIKFDNRFSLSNLQDTFTHIRESLFHAHASMWMLHHFQIKQNGFKSVLKYFCLTCRVCLRMRVMTYGIRTKRIFFFFFFWKRVLRKKYIQSFLLISGYGYTTLSD